MKQLIDFQQKGLNAGCDMAVGITTRVQTAELWLAKPTQVFGELYEVLSASIFSLAHKSPNGDSRRRTDDS